MTSSKRAKDGKKWQMSGTFTCSFCPFRSTSKQSIKLHEEHHSIRLEFQCTFCSFSAAKEWGLKFHINRVHSQQNKIVGTVSVPAAADLPEFFRENHNKDNPIRHTNKLIKVLDAMTKEFPPEVAQNTDEQDENRTCRAELIKVAKDMKLAQVVLMSAEKSLEQETSSARVKSDQLRQRIEELETKDRPLSAKRAYLLELQERIQQQITELMGQENQLEQELVSGEQEEPVNKKTKSDSISSGSSERMQQERLLSDVKVKLSVIEEEDKVLLARIRDVEKELAENVRNFTELRAELDALNTGNPATGEPSPNSAQLKALKREQLGRIAEFSRLQKKLFHVSCVYVLEDLYRIEQELVNFVGDVDEI